MLTIKKDISLPDTYPLERIGSLANILFFDIETTGFSGDYATLYLIGCTWFETGSWHLIQWFADTLEAEPVVLDTFFAFMKQFKILVHFNGDGFDIPFLMKRCARYHLPYDFSEVESFDIYKKCRPYRKMLGLESMRQKAVEQFLRISREDRYNGGQLIEVYQDYLHTRSEQSFDLLMLHNEDDLKGMPSILPILNYPDFFEHPFCLSKHHIEQSTAPLMHLTYESTDNIVLPVSFSREQPPIHALATDNRLEFTIELYQGTLKHFFPDYQNYYYLIYEDTAVHKSIGEFVDRSARKKATAATCYTRRNGCFVPQYDPIWDPVMKCSPKDKLCYAPVEDICLEDTACSEAYLHQLLTALGLNYTPPLADRP